MLVFSLCQSRSNWATPDQVVTNRTRWTLVTAPSIRETRLARLLDARRPRWAPSRLRLDGRERLVRRAGVGSFADPRLASGRAHPSPADRAGHPGLLPVQLPRAAHEAADPPEARGAPASGAVPRAPEATRRRRAAVRSG